MRIPPAKREGFFESPITMRKEFMSDKAVFGYLALFAFVTLFFISPDSYTHDLYFRVDSGCFFTCGKAWMNGMVPYVDFTDSKGPLLWLIYGVGYLISHYDYIGVFWLSVASYALTYFLSYKAALLLVADKPKAFLCAVLMSVAFFYPYVFHEMRAENFGHLYFMLTLYHTLRLLTQKNQRMKHICQSFFAYGIAFGATLLIKYSFTVMIAPMMLYGLYGVIREKRRFMIPLLAAICGALVIILPFLIYFLVAGNLGAFINEYFINTMKTVAPEGNPLTSYLHEWKIAMNMHHLLALLVLLAVGTIAIGASMRRYRLFPFLCILFMFAIGVRHIGPFHNYYLNAASIGLLFFFAFVLKKIHVRWRPWALAAVSAIILIGTTVTAFKFKPFYHVLFWENDKERTDFYNIANLVGQIDKPKFINLLCCGTGLETPSGALPASKYWILQTGATPEMDQQHLAHLKDADFIFMKFWDRAAARGITHEEMEKLGFHLCYKWYNSRIYTKHNVRLTKQHKTPTNWDILLKRHVE